MKTRVCGTCVLHQKVSCRNITLATRPTTKTVYKPPNAKQDLVANSKEERGQTLTISTTGK